METLPLARDIAGLGSLPVSQPALATRFSCSEKATLGAVGGRLCPWQRGPFADFGTKRRHARVRAYPVGSGRPTRLWLHARPRGRVWLHTEGSITVFNRAGSRPRML